MLYNTKTVCCWGKGFPLELIVIAVIVVAHSSLLNMVGIILKLNIVLACSNTDLCDYL